MGLNAGPVTFAPSVGSERMRRSTAEARSSAWGAPALDTSWTNVFFRIAWTPSGDRCFRLHMRLRMLRAWWTKTRRGRGEERRRIVLDL